MFWCSIKGKVKEETGACSPEGEKNEVCSYVVETGSGKVRGADDQAVVAWKGIPYAKAPVGALRFVPAKPVEPWSGVRACMEFGPICPQKSSVPGRASEDCLFLNIWSPAADEKKRAVLFFVHGGSFASGAGSEKMYHGANLAKTHDVVVVTINYRVGVLGFLDFSFLGEEFHPNCGLYDVVHALRWTKENIKGFGGDPEHITVFGQSAGGTITATLPTVPAAKGLFEKCIVMSGCPALLQGKEECIDTSRKFLQFMGISGAKELRSMTAKQLVAREKEFSHSCGLGTGTFRIEIDGALVPDFPIPAVGKGIAKGVPMLIGTTKEEMAFLLVKPLSKLLDVSNMLDEVASRESAEVKKRIYKAYEKCYGTRLGRSMLYTDIVFRMGSVWYAEWYSEFADVWMYRFDYETAVMKLSGLHAFHSSDLPYVFGNFGSFVTRLMLLLTPMRKKTKEVSRSMQHDFVTFAKTGSLPWEKCSADNTPAKCYGERETVGSMVEPVIERQYEKTVFKKLIYEKEKAK